MYTKAVHFIEMIKVNYTDIERWATAIDYNCVFIFVNFFKDLSIFL